MISAGFVEEEGTGQEGGRERSNGSAATRYRCDFPFTHTAP